MEPVELRCYEELNRHLPPECRRRSFAVEIGRSLPVGALLAHLGVPLAEVELILVDGVSRGAEHRLAGGERVTVYPVFEALDVTPEVRLPGRPLRRLRFAVDRCLADLARRLAERGHPVCQPAAPDRLPDLEREGWVALHPRSQPHPARQRAYGVASTDAAGQVDEVVRRFDLPR